MVGEQLAIKAAEKVAEKASNVLLGDIVVIEGKVFRVVKEGRKKRLEPVNVRVHINPLTAALGLGVGLLGVGLGIWWLGLGVKPLSADEKRQLEAQLAANEQGIRNLEKNLAAKEAAGQCIITERFGFGDNVTFITTDECAGLRESIKVLQIEGNRLRARLRIPFHFVERGRFSLFEPEVKVSVF